MIIHDDFEQGSLQWLRARAGIPTASEFDQLLTPKFEIRTGEMPKTYLSKKLAEAWSGMPLVSEQNSFAMEQGVILEESAIPWYELEFGEQVRRVGFITTDDGRIGCSPDGLISDGGIEIKCPQSHTHIGYLLAGDVPKDYLCQVHGSLFVAGAPFWKFVSYNRRLPPLVLTVFRDDDIQKRIAEALAGFLERFDASMKRLVEMNDGIRPERPKLAPLPKTEEPEPEDVVP